MKKRFPVAVPFVSALCLALYYYAISVPMRFLFTGDGGAIIIRELRSPLERDVVLFALASFALMYAAGVILALKERGPARLAYFCIPGLYVFSFLPQTVSMPEFIPVAAVILPSAALAAFVSSLICSSRADAVPAGRRSPGRVASAVFLASLAALFASGYRVNETTGYHSGDEGHYLTMARSMAEDLDLDIRNQIDGYTPAMRARVHISPHSPQGYGYSWHPPGLSFLFAPFFRVYEEHRSQKRGALFSLYVIGALLASQMYLAASAASGRTSIGLFVAGVFIFSSPLWIYSIRAYPMMPGGLCILYCWRKLKVFAGASASAFALFNILMAWLAWLHDTFLPAYGILGAAVFVLWVKDVINKKLLITLLLQALNIAVFVFFRFRWYGSNFFGQHGGLFNFWPGLFGAWFDFFRGAVFYSPIHLAAFVLLVAYAFKKRDFMSFMLLLLYLSVYIPGSSAGTHWTGGSSHPGRRLAPCIPLAAVSLAFFLGEKKRYSFYWLVVFCSIISVGFMSYVILFNPHAFTRPLSSVVLAEPLFRPMDFHLPNFGTSFRNFPWAHFYFAAVNIFVFILFWVFMVRKEKNPRPVFMVTGIAATAVWIFASIGVMKALFPTTPPVPRSLETAFSGNVLRLAEPAREDRVFLYSLKSESGVFEPGFSAAELPRNLTLSRGLYELVLTGNAAPGARAEASVRYTRRNILLARFSVSAGPDGAFSARKYLLMPDGSGTVGVFLDEGFSVEEASVTPVPPWLERIRREISASGRSFGMAAYLHEAPVKPEKRIFEGEPVLSSPYSESDVSNMLDGNPRTRWTVFAPQAPGQYFTADLGGLFMVEGVMLCQGEFWKDWPRGLSVYTSVDGESWRLAYEDEGSGGYVFEDRNDHRFLGMEKRTEAAFPAVAARWIRVEQTGSEDFYWWSVAGLEIVLGGD